MEIIKLAIRILHGYSIGMAKYRELNDKNLTRKLAIQNSLLSINEEFIEYVNDLKKLNLKNAFYELCNVYHTLVVALVSVIFPSYITRKSYIWYLVFFWSGILTPVKHSRRFLKYGCIKSLNRCKINDHNCINNNLTRRRYFICK